MMELFNTFINVVAILLMLFPFVNARALVKTAELRHEEPRLWVLKYRQFVFGCAFIASTLWAVIASNRIFHLNIPAPIVIILFIVESFLVTLPAIVFEWEYELKDRLRRMKN